MLCRQLCSANSDALWFVFAGQPLRLSLVEFQEVTGLCCSSFPPAADLLAATTHNEGAAPYWYTLIGRNIGNATVEDLLSSLKPDPQMPGWQKFRLALVVIVEGILLCRTQPVKPSIEVVEMVKNVHFFLHYPWGQHSFNRLLWMVKDGDYIEDDGSLIQNLQQSSLDVHGFPLVIQLVVFRTIHALLKYLPHVEDPTTFLAQTVSALPKCRAFHAANIIDVENDSSIEILFPHPSFPPFVPSAQTDHKLVHLEHLISSCHKFTNASWPSRDVCIRSLSSSTKRKQLTSSSGEPSPDELSLPNVTNCCKKFRGHNCVQTVDYILELKLQGFKESLLADLGNLFLTANGMTSSKTRGDSFPLICNPSVSMLHSQLTNCPPDLASVTCETQHHSSPLEGSQVSTLPLTRSKRNTRPTTIRHIYCPQRSPSSCIAKSTSAMASSSSIDSSATDVVRLLAPFSFVPTSFGEPRPAPPAPNSARRGSPCSLYVKTLTLGDDSIGSPQTLTTGHVYPNGKRDVLPSESPILLPNPLHTNI